MYCFVFIFLFFLLSSFFLFFSIFSWSGLFCCFLVPGTLALHLLYLPCLMKCDCCLVYSVSRVCDTTDSVSLSDESARTLGGCADVVG